MLLIGLLVPALTSTPSAHASHAIYTGTLTDLDGNPLADVMVAVYEVDTWMRPTVVVRPIGNGTTDATGAYRIDSDLGAAATRDFVCFNPGPEYAPECYDDMVQVFCPGSDCTPEYNGWVPHYSGVGPDNHINVSLEPASTITGRLTTVTGTPVGDAEVTVWHGASCCKLMAASATTNADGRYTVGRLKSATYFVRFRDPQLGIVEYWNDRNSQSEATPLEVATGESVTGIDAVFCKAVTNVAAPTISGTAQVGQPLTASGDAWTPEGTTVTYRWVVGPDTVSSDDPTGRTYVPTATDVGQTIRVHASGTHPQCVNGSAWSTSTAVVVAAPVTTPPTPPLTVVNYLVRPRVKGTPKVGRVVRVTKGVWQPTAVTLKYHWYAGGKAITGATHRRLTLTSKHVGKRLTVRVKATAAGHPKAIVWTKPTVRIKP